MKLSLFSRLMLGYSVLLFFGVAMSVYGIIQLGRVRDVTHSIILVDNAILDYHKGLTDALLSETRYEKKFVIMNDAALAEGFQTSAKEFEDILGGALLIAETQHVQGALSRASDLHAAYKALFAEERALLRSGQPYDADRYEETKEGLVNAILEELAKVRLGSQSDIVDKIRKLNRAGVQAISVAMAVTAVSLVAGVLLSLVITRSITVPLKRMEKKTVEIGDGVHGADLNIASPPEIGALARAFNFMSAKLREVDTMKSDFFALMSHELRTPLTSIKEGTNLMLEGAGGQVTDKQRRILTIMAEESNRLIGLVSSLLDLSKLEAGMLAYQFTRAELAPLIARAVGEVTPLAEAKRIRINADVRAELRATMDEERILQVLRNLLGNALKFTPEGGAVRIAARRVQSSKFKVHGEVQKNSELRTPNAELQSDFVEVSVSDSGPGIPKEHQAAIFDKFRQASLERANKIQGTGLGLAIVKHIILDHGGRVWVESEPGSGSTFTFVLPA